MARIKSKDQLSLFDEPPKPKRELPQLPWIDCLREQIIRDSKSLLDCDECDRTFFEERISSYRMEVLRLEQKS